MASGTTQAKENLATLKQLLANFDTVIGDIAEVHDFKDGSEAKFYEILARSSVVRQREAMNAIISLCENGHGAFGVCFLRPAYEEMLWMMYLKDNPADAAGISTKLTIKNVGESIAAQANFLGPKTMEKLGFTEHFVSEFKVFCDMQIVWLKACGKKLGWRVGSDMPSLAHIAQQVKLKEEYDFIYQATSRFVHFSPQELCRRAWGNRDGLTIASSHFAPFWGRFAIYWSMRIFINTFVTVYEILNLQRDSIDESIGSEIAALIAKLPPVAIVTVDELDWVKCANPR